MPKKLFILLFVFSALLVYSRAYAQTINPDWNLMPKDHKAQSLVFVYFIACIMLLIKFLFIKLEAKIYGKHKIEGYVPAGIIKNNNKEIIIAIRESDPRFGIDAFLEHAKEIFRMLKEAYSSRDISKIPVLTEGHFVEHKTQINRYIKNKQKDITKIKNFDKAYLYKYNKTQEYEYISVYLEVRLTNYVVEIIDEQTEPMIRGSRDEEKLIKYLLVLRRDRVVLAAARKTAPEILRCPRCSAPALINNVGHCVYCNAIIKTGNYFWALDDIDIIWPDSRYGSGGVFVNNKQTDRYKKELELNG